MNDIERVLSKELREDIEHIRRRYQIPTEVMSHLARNGVRNTRWSDDTVIASFVDGIDDTLGDNATDGILVYLNNTMDVIRNARERVQAESTVGRFVKQERETLYEYIKRNKHTTKDCFHSAFSRFKSHINASNYACDGVLFAFGKQNYQKLLSDQHGDEGRAVQTAYRWYDCNTNKVTNVVEGYCQRVDVLRDDKLIETGYIVKVGLDFRHRKRNDLDSVRISGKDYLVTHVKKVDHPYVDEDGRTCYEAHVLGVNKKELDYKVGYLVVHTGHNKVSKAFGEGDTGAKSASQLLDRRLKQSVVDTLLDSF
jgi:hypothetical protein